MLQKPEHFGVFCKTCGTYDVNIYIDFLANLGKGFNHSKIVFQCLNKECDSKEVHKG